MESARALKESLPFIWLHTLSVTLMFGVVLFFYYQMAMEVSILHQKSALSTFFSRVEAKIYAVSPEEKMFVMPRSFVYSVVLHDREGTVLFSPMKKIPPVLVSGFTIANDRLCLSGYLHDNALGADVLSVSKSIERAQVWGQVLWLIALAALYLLLSTAWLLERSRAPLLEANRRLKCFMDDATHELRVPLGVVRLNAEMLREDSDNPRFRKRIGRILGASTTLENLYNSLEYGVRRDKIIYPVRELDLSLLLKERIRFFTEIAETKRLMIHDSIVADVTITMSEEEAIRLIDNNLSNAIKYSYDGGNITVTLERSGREILLSFIDEGEGIGDVDSIFQRFHRENHTQGGLGLGLGIVKEICRKYEIDIKVESKKEKGSCFRYVFQT